MTGFTFPWQKPDPFKEISLEDRLPSPIPEIPSPATEEVAEELSDPFDEGYSRALKDVAEVIRHWRDRASFGLLRRNRKAFEGLVADLQKKIKGQDR